MESIMLLLDEMEGYLQECNSLPFSSKVVVNMEVLYEFMADLRMKLPEEIKRSKRILEEKDKLIEEAKATAKAIDAETKEHVEHLLDEHEIRKQAVKEAEELMARATQAAEEITDGAYNYVDDLLKQNEEVIRQMLEKTSQHYGQYEKYLRSQMDVIRKNREDIAK
jgi:cell division septum initiation protein DivIVA